MVSYATATTFRSYGVWEGIARAYRGSNDYVAMRRFAFRGGGPYTSATVFSKLLLIWSVESKLWERIVERMRS